MTLEILRAAGLCTVQDLGRRGHMHEAVPPGGALVPELLVAANRRARNADDAAAIEVIGRLLLRASSPVEIATDRDGPRVLQAGEELVVESEPLRCTYVALRGGVDAPLVLDGRGTLLCAGLGKPLAKGDILRAAGQPEVTAREVASREVTSRVERVEQFATGETITVIAGPDLDAFAPDVLDNVEQATYRVSSTSDRVGTRLEVATTGEGPRGLLTRSAGYLERSRPMVIGALEVPRDGMPIVLGPEHPTTGGYPIIAVIASAELGRFFAIRLGGTVRFRVAR